MMNSSLLVVVVQRTGMIVVLVTVVVLFLDCRFFFARAARHGLQLTGKLQRLAKQEQQVSSENENDKSVDCQHRKAKKRSQANRKPTQSQGEPGQDLCIAVDGDFTMDSPDCQIPKRKRKAKHRQ